MLALMITCWDRGTVALRQKRFAPVHDEKDWQGPQNIFLAARSNRRTIVSSMNPRSRNIIAFLVVVAIVFTAWLVLRSREPQYEGKKLSEWLDQYRHDDFESGPDSETATAIRSIGTNAIPLLLKYLSVKDSALRKQIVQFAEKQEVFKLNIPSANAYHEAAIGGFHALGVLGKPAVPSLVTLMNDTNSGPSAMRCLCCIGEDAVGVLIQGLSSTNSEVRAACASGLGEVGTNRPAALPALIALLSDPDSQVRFSTIFAIGRFRHNHREVVSSLAERMGTLDQREVGFISRVLAQFGSNALPALPKLEQTLSEGKSSWPVVAITIESISPRTAIPAVLKLLADPKTQVRDRGARVLGRFPGVMRKDAAAVFDLARTEHDPQVLLQFRIAAHRILLRTRTNAVPELATFQNGILVRGPLSEKRVALCLWGDLFSEGAEAILTELELRQVSTSFFLTDQFPADQDPAPMLGRLFDKRNYLGNVWDSLHPASYAEIPPAFRARYGLPSAPSMPATVPVESRANVDQPTQNESKPGVQPFSECVRQKHIDEGLEDFVLLPSPSNDSWWLKGTDNASLTIIAPTPGTLSGLDNTQEGQTNFVSSQAIFDSILRREREDPNGLNGFILMFHLGSGPGRTDKFHPRFGELLAALAARGYSFVRVNELFERGQ